MFMDIRKNKKNNKIKIELPSAIGWRHVQTMMMKVLKQKNEGGNRELVKHTVN